MGVMRLRRGAAAVALGLSLLACLPGRAEATFSVTITFSSYELTGWVADSLLGYMVPLVEPMQGWGSISYDPDTPITDPPVPIPGAVSGFMDFQYNPPPGINMVVLDFFGPIEVWMSPEAIYGLDTGPDGNYLTVSTALP